MVDAVAVVVVIGVQCYCEIVAAVISYKTFDICNGRKWDQCWGEFQGTYIVPAHVLPGSTCIGVYVRMCSLFFPLSDVLNILNITVLQNDLYLLL